MEEARPADGQKCNKGPHRQPDLYVQGNLRTGRQVERGSADGGTSAIVFGGEEGVLVPLNWYVSGCRMAADGRKSLSFRRRIFGLTTPSY